MDLYRSKHSDKKYPNSNSSSNDRPSRSFRNSRDNDREDTTVTCADCGDQCTVPFVPRSNKPVYCSDCFRQNKPSSNDDRGSRYSRDDRPSRDDRGSRYSRETDRHETVQRFKIFKRRQTVTSSTFVQDIQETTDHQEILEIMTEKTQL